MEKKNPSAHNESRRDFIKTVGAGTVSASLGAAGMVGSGAAQAAADGFRGILPARLESLSEHEV